MKTGKDTVHARGTGNGAQREKQKESEEKIGGDAESVEAERTIAQLDQTRREAD